MDKTRFESVGSGSSALGQGTLYRVYLKLIKAVRWSPGLLAYKQIIIFFCFLSSQICIETYRCIGAVVAHRGVDPGGGGGGGGQGVSPHENMGANISFTPPPPPIIPTT